MAHPVTWFQISGQDGKKLQSFYKKVFAWSMSPAPGQTAMAMVEPATGGIAGGVGPSPDGKNGVSVFVTVDDLAAHLKKIEKAGGKVVQQPTDLPSNMGAIAGFLDPAGNFVGLWKAPAEVKPPVKAKNGSSAKPEKNGASAKADKADKNGSSIKLEKSAKPARNGASAKTNGSAVKAKPVEPPAKPSKAAAKAPPAKPAKKAKSKR